MFTKKIILASASPRRAEILKMANVNFEVRASNIEEIVQPHLSPEEIAQDLAQQKTAVVHNAGDGSITLGADTIVVLENEILGKPNDAAEAKKTLEKLSGKMHCVITGVAIFSGERQMIFADTTEVYFGELSTEQIDFYIEKYQPLDKAGAYAIQEFIGAIGIKKIVGDYYNVVGLPINKVIRKLDLL